MRLRSVRHQKTGQLELSFGTKGEAPTAERSGETPTASNENERSGITTDFLMEEVVQRSNAAMALRRVRKNKGSPGIDGMTVQELPAYLAEHWRDIQASLLDGTYQPQPVRRQEIPKSGGGVRELGIPCALDRLIQQCILQVLQPRWDSTFSEHSYGFRPGCRAHDALCAAQRYIQQGRDWVVDVDLETFFDRIQHDVLMGKLAQRIADKRLLRLIRRYLEAGVMVNGVVMERHEGSPQGSPLSPLLANVLLDEVDKELEKRGLSFCRYADDCNVYVRSKRAGDDAMETLRHLFTNLKLRVNETKSAVARPWERKFLGYTFWIAKKTGELKRGVADKALATMKERVRTITSRTRGRSIAAVIEELRPYLLGWKNYFRLQERPSLFRELDGWIRHRLRMLHLKQWKNGPNAYRQLRARGLSHQDAAKVAGNLRSWWRNSHMALNRALPPSYFDNLGLPRLAT
jgi:RNA-directed DNA polymerase